MLWAALVQTKIQEALSASSEFIYHWHFLPNYTFYQNRYQIYIFYQNSCQIYIFYENSYQIYTKFRYQNGYQILVKSVNEVLFLTVMQ